MKQDFDSNVPRHEQLLRVATNKSGHKHMHKKGPGRAGNDAAKKAAHKSQTLSRLRKRVSEAIRAYWRGERDEYPTV